MKFHYYPETDSLYIELSAKQGVDSREIAPNIVIDFDTRQQAIGIDIQQASKNIDLSILETKSLPIEMLSVAA